MGLDLDKYPRRTVLAVKPDKNGMKYITAYANTKGVACVAFKGHKWTVRGSPKMSLRIGESSHGEEVLFELLIDDKVRPVKKAQRTEHNTVEIYMPKDNAISFLEEAIAYMKKQSAAGMVFNPDNGR